MSKIVYQTDASGHYVGPTIADANPLEPDAYLIPGGAVEIEPPALTDGERARWTGHVWEVEVIPEPEPITPADPWDLLRVERDRRLSDSDRYVLADRWETYSPEHRAAWAAYRQALRDLPEATDDPAAPVWPVVPA